MNFANLSLSTPEVRSLSEKTPLTKIEPKLFRYPHLAGFDISYRISPSRIVPWGDRSKCFDAVLVNMRAGLFGVADTSEHPVGGIPSVIAVKAAEQSIVGELNAKKDFFDISPEEIRTMLRNAFRLANHAVWERKARFSRERYATPAETELFETTMTLAILRGSHFYVGHMGDSFAVLVPNTRTELHWKAFTLRTDAARMLTRNDSVLAANALHSTLHEELYFRECASTHYAGRAMQRCLGRKTDLDDSDIWLHDGALSAGDVLILATDGLLDGARSGRMRERDVEAMLRRAPHVQDTCINLIDRAREGGSTDDIALIVAAYDPGFTVTPASLGHDASSYRTSGAKMKRLKGMPSPVVNFIGRKHSLNAIYDIFCQTSPPRVTLLDLYGMSGSGKTQLALKYAYTEEYNQLYDHVLWIDAENDQHVGTSLLEIAKHFAIENVSGANVAYVASAVRQALSKCRRFLLIIDNVERRTFASGTLLHVLLFDRGDMSCVNLNGLGNGDILVTTRERDRDGFEWCHSHPVEMFTSDEAVQLFTNSHSSAGASPPIDDVKRVAKALDFYPLGIALASRYIDSQGLSFARYYDLLASQSQDVGLADDSLVAMLGAPRSAFAAMELTYRLLATRYPAAASFFKFCTYLAPDDIPLDIVFKNVKELEAILVTVDGCLDNRDTFNNTYVGPLTKLSLASVQDGSLSVHRLVQHFVRNVVARIAIGFCKKAVNVNDGCEPDAAAPACMLPHLAMAITHGAERGVASPDDLLTLAIRCDAAGDLSRAIELARDVRQGVSVAAATTGGDDNALRIFVVASVRLATFIEHTSDLDDALPILDELDKMHNAGVPALQKTGKLHSQYMWARYARGVIQRKRRRFKDAASVLRDVSVSHVAQDARVLADHHLAVVKLELGQWADALKTFVDNMQSGPMLNGFRRAYEFRRAGQAHAFLAAAAAREKNVTEAELRTDNAKRDFEEARRISNRFYNLRYVRECDADEKSFIKWPMIIRQSNLAAFTIDELAKLLNETNLKESQCTDVFRVLRAGGRRYLAELNKSDKTTTQRFVDFDEVHTLVAKDEYWHATIAVAVLDKKREEVAILRADSTPRREKKNISVTGHVAIGEKSKEAAVYKTFKELGILKDPEDFRLIGEELGFCKRGGPVFPVDEYDGKEFRYHDSNKKNNELVSLYELVVDDQEYGLVANSCDWRRIDEVRSDVRKNPTAYGSSLRQFIDSLAQTG